MTQKVKQIGSVVLFKPLYVKEFNEPNTMAGESIMSAAGSHIVYSAPINTPYRTLETLADSGWLDETNVSDLKALWLTDATYTLTYDDDTTETVRFAHEKQITFNPVSLGACYYNVVIPMAKV